MKEILIFAILAISNCLKNLGKKEILTPNNLDQVYQTNMQKEMIATSDYSCIFRCTSKVSEELINRKINEVVSSNTPDSYSAVQKLDQQYYCTSIKPLYIVKL
jgi:hypothetical protein